MSHRVKCRECRGCMNAVWVNNTRYWHCWLCKLYYAGMDAELVVVEDPYKTINKPQEIENDNDNNAPSI